MIGGTVSAVVRWAERSARFRANYPMSSGMSVSRLAGTGRAIRPPRPRRRCAWGRSHDPYTRCQRARDGPRRNARPNPPTRHSRGRKRAPNNMGTLPRSSRHRRRQNAGLRDRNRRTPEQSGRTGHDGADTSGRPVVLTPSARVPATRLRGGPAARRRWRSR